MYVKWSVLVLCVLLFNFSESRKCGNLLNCASDWIADSFIPNITVLIDSYPNVSKTKPLDVDNVFSDLSRLLVNNNINIFKKGRLFKIDGNHTKLRIQTFEINDSIPDTITSKDTKKIDIEKSKNDYDYINSDDHDQEPKNVEKEWQDFKEIKTIVNNIAMNTHNKNTSKPNPYNVNDIINVITKNNQTNSLLNYIFNVMFEYAGSQNTTNNDAVNTFIDDDYDNDDDDYDMINTKTQYTTTATSNLVYVTSFSKTENTPLSKVTTGNSIVLKNYNDVNAYIESNDENNNSIDKTMIKEKKPTEIQQKHQGITSGNITINIKNDGGENIMVATSAPHTELVKKVTENVGGGGNDMVNDFDYNNDNFIASEGVNNSEYLDINYIDLYKDTTNEPLDVYTRAIYIPTTTAISKYIDDEEELEDGIEVVYKWIATIFIKNNETNQFQYICDGTLISKQVVLTAARCVMRFDTPVNTTDVLIILGKRSLQTMDPNEIAERVKSIKIHEKFSIAEGIASNDLAMVILDKQVSFNAYIQPTPLDIKDVSEPLAIATTGWHVGGLIRKLYLKLESRATCIKHTDSMRTFCAALQDDVNVCPSFGGVYVDLQSDHQWRLKGIATGSPTTTGVCFNKDLTFTNIQNYLEWIKQNVTSLS